MNYWMRNYGLQNLTNWHISTFQLILKTDYTRLPYIILKEYYEDGRIRNWNCCYYLYRTWVFTDEHWRRATLLGKERSRGHSERQYHQSKFRTKYFQRLLLQINIYISSIISSMLNKIFYSSFFHMKTYRDKFYSTKEYGWNAWHTPPETGNATILINSSSVSPQLSKFVSLLPMQ